LQEAEARVLERVPELEAVAPFFHFNGAHPMAMQDNAALQQWLC
jgi:hypothetical protein